MSRPAPTKNPLKNLDRKTFKRLIGYIFEGYKFHIIAVFICILTVTFSVLQGTLFMQDLIDVYILPYIGNENPDFSALLTAMIRVGSFYLLGVIASFIQARIMVLVTQGTMKRMRDEVFEHMEELPISYFDTNSHGDIMSVYTNDIDTLEQMIGQSLPQVLSSIITIVAVFISMLVINIPLTAVSLALVFLMFFVSGKIAGKSGKNFAKQQNDLGKVNGYIEEMMEGGKVVKVFCHEEIARKEFEELNENLYESAYNAHRFANIIMPINGNIGNMSFVLCTILGSVLAISNIGGFTLGCLASFLTLNRNFTNPIAQVSQQLNAVVMALAGANRVFALLDEEVESDDGSVTLVNTTMDKDDVVECEGRTGNWAWKYTHEDASVTYKEVRGDVVFDKVDFGYVEDKQVLYEVELFATPGQKIAFVGSTGAGKTTITNLINRFYDIQDGKIRYDGINVNKIKKADLRKSLGIVLQDTHLFTGTVMENIRYGKLLATDEEVIAAAKLANADGFITRLPEGYQTELRGDGDNLSQGQRQLLAIARAAIANPPVLILDEATSSIDTRTEHLVQDGMDKLMNGRTTFVIAHRLSTVKNSDCIMVLEKGRVIERGTHDELLEEKGRYYQLYTGNQIAQ